MSFGNAMCQLLSNASFSAYLLKTPSKNMVLVSLLLYNTVNMTVSINLSLFLTLFLFVLTYLNMKNAVRKANHSLALSPMPTYQQGKTEKNTIHILNKWTIFSYCFIFHIITFLFHRLMRCSSLLMPFYFICL